MNLHQYQGMGVEGCFLPQKKKKKKRERIVPGEVKLSKFMQSTSLRQKNFLSALPVTGYNQIRGKSSEHQRCHCEWYQRGRAGPFESQSQTSSHQDRFPAPVAVSLSCEFLWVAVVHRRFLSFLFYNIFFFTCCFFFFFFCQKDNL